MDVDLDARIERALAQGHPEADAYLPRGLDLSHRPTTPPHRQRPFLRALAAVAIVAVAIVVGSRLDDMRPSGTPAGALEGQESATPSLSASTAPALELEIVESPVGELTSDLSARGVRCFAATIHFRISPDPAELDRQINEAGILRGWLGVGSRWVGNDRVAMAQAFGAIRAAAVDPDGGLVWILTERSGRLAVVELMATETPRGHLVWESRNTTAEADCGAPTPPPLSIAVVENPREVAMEEMAKRGARCFQSSDILTVAPDVDLLDRQIRDAGIEVGWLTAGTRWVGEDPTPIVLAAGSDFAVAGLDQRRLWTIVRLDDTLVSREFRAVITPNGHWVWIRGDTDREIPC